MLLPLSESEQIRIYSGSTPCSRLQYVCTRYILRYIDKTDTGPLFSRWRKLIRGPRVSSRRRDHADIKLFCGLCYRFMEAGAIMFKVIHSCIHTRMKNKPSGWGLPYLWDLEL